MVSRVVLGVGVVLVLAVGGFVAVALVGRPGDVAWDAGTPGPAGPRTDSPSPTCPAPWDCVQAGRFAAAESLMKSVAGHVGIVVSDRVTGAQWHGGESAYQIWAGSTPKLAMAVALREQASSGEITLDAAANSQIDAMLSISDNRAADTLWNRYLQAGPFMQRLHDRYGMATATYVDGFPSRWGFIKCSAQDLVSLATYILEELNPDDREYIVHAMRTVGPPQQWGVWGAGPRLQPGVKDGWSIEQDDGEDHWITATVGFAGPDERYVIAAMYHQPPGGDTLEQGVQLLTDLVATVFGAPVPAPVVMPPPD